MKKSIISILLVFTILCSVSYNVAFADSSTSAGSITVGNQGSEVTYLQNDLRVLGYFSGTTTGYFGSKTMQSVVYFQRDNNLKIDGIVGQSTQREIDVEKVLKQAKSYIGVPYVWGGTSPSGFDCSGFTHYVLLKNNIVIPRTAAAQYNVGNWVPKNQLMPGDLVFFSTYKAGASHTGIYIGNNQFVHASSGAGHITISDLSKSYYAEHYIGAKRMF